MPLQLVQLPPPPQPPPPQPPPPQPPPPQPPLPLPLPLQPPGPAPTLPPARHASRRRSREARSVRTTIRIISQITPGTITMTTTIIRMLVTTHPLANRCRRCRRHYLEVSAHLRRWVRVVGYSFSSAIVLVGYLFLAVHHCSSRGSRWWVLCFYLGRRGSRGSLGSSGSGTPNHRDGSCSPYSSCQLHHS
jgi:uncharacterized membrane protein YgcG